MGPPAPRGRGRFALTDPTSITAPDVAGRIVASGLTKVFGDIKAVDDLSFSVEPGSVTGLADKDGCSIVVKAGQ